MSAATRATCESHNEARRTRARREFFRIEHAADTAPARGAPETRFLGLYRVTGENGREYDVLVRDPNPEHHVNRCSCLDYESNNLGTCKHVEAVLLHLRVVEVKRFLTPDLVAVAWRQKDPRVCSRT